MKILYYLGLDNKGYKEQETIEITDYEADEWISFGLEQGYQIDTTLSKEEQVQMVIDESFRDQYNDDRRYFYHTRRFRDIEDKEGNVINEAELIADDSPTPLEALIAEEEEMFKVERENKLLELLNAKQKRRYIRLKEISVEELANEEHVSRSSIYDTIEQIKNKIKKL